MGLFAFNRARRQVQADLHDGQPAGGAPAPKAEKPAGGGKTPAPKAEKPAAPMTEAKA